jgi:tetratricopeptide (TPR) repeat protein
MGKSSEMAMKKKMVTIGPRATRQWLFGMGKIVLPIATITLAPFALFYLLSTAAITQGDHLVQGGKMAEALSAYERGLAFNSNSDQAYLKIGLVLQREKRYLEALAAYDRAYLINPNLKLDRDRAKGFLELGDALGKQEAWNEAIEAYRKAIAIAPNSSSAQFQLGLALHTLGRWDDAATAFQKAIDLNPRQARAYFYLGEAYREQKLWESASIAYEQALQFNPDRAKIFQQLGKALQEQGKWTEATRIYLQGITRVSNNGDLYHQLGKSLAAQGKVNEAIVAYQQALRISPKNAQIRENLCYAHLTLGEVDEGLTWCRQAVQLDPNLANAKFLVQEIQRGRLIHDNPKLLEMPERIPNRQVDPLVPLKRAIVKIIVLGKGNGSVGTGWIVKHERDRAWIVTNRHVIADSFQRTERNARIFLEFYSDPPSGQIRRRSRAKILYVTDPSDGLDIAVLESKDPPEDIHPLTLASLPIARTQPVKSIGNPFNQKDWTVTKGTVNDNTEKSLNLAMLVVAGQSGSPVFNDQNQVVGVISQSGLFCPRIAGTNTLDAIKLGCGLAIPIDRVREKLSAWGVLQSRF